jgi:hypothetical protein
MIYITQEGVDRLVNDLTELFRDLYDPELFNPVRYIQSSIKRMVDESSASDDVKERVNHKTPIQLASRLHPNLANVIMHGWDGFGLTEEVSEFTLEEIVTDTYRRKLIREYNVIQWPGDFPDDLINTLTAADLQASYQTEVDRRLTTPKMVFLAKLQSRIIVEKHLRAFAEKDDTPDVYKELVERYFKGDTVLKTVQIKRRTKEYDVSQCVYLRYPAGTQTSEGGLLVFLNEPAQSAVLILPRAGRREFIEGSKTLHRLIHARLPLYAQLTPGNDKLRYHEFFYGSQIQYICPLQFAVNDDVFGELHSRTIKRLKSDIDVLVSTDTERMNDLLLQTGITILGAIGLATTAPAGPSLALTRAIVGLLSGGGSVAFKVLRGANADLPQEAQAFYNEAMLDTLKLLVGPIVELATGSEHGSQVVSEVIDIVYDELAEATPEPE